MRWYRRIWQELLQRGPMGRAFRARLKRHKLLHQGFHSLPKREKGNQYPKPRPEEPNNGAFAPQSREKKRNINWEKQTQKTPFWGENLGETQTREKKKTLPKKKRGENL